MATVLNYFARDQAFSVSGIETKSEDRTCTKKALKIINLLSVFYFSVDKGRLGKTLSFLLCELIDYGRPCIKTPVTV